MILILLMKQILFISLINKNELVKINEALGPDNFDNPQDGFEISST